MCLYVHACMRVFSVIRWLTHILADLCNKCRLTDACVAAVCFCPVIKSTLKHVTREAADYFNVKWVSLQKRRERAWCVCVCFRVMYAAYVFETCSCCLLLYSHTQSVPACYLGSTVVMVTRRWSVFVCTSEGSRTIAHVRKAERRIRLRGMRERKRETSAAPVDLAVFSVHVIRSERKLRMKLFQSLLEIVSI